MTRLALERDEKRRNHFQLMIGEQYRSNQLVFVDEAACNRYTSNRGQAWAPIGDRARKHDYFVQGVWYVELASCLLLISPVFGRYYVLPAISLDDVLHLDILTRSWTRNEFCKYIAVLLDNMNPFPQRNSVIVMDNASAHHFEGLQEMVEARCMPLLLVILTNISFRGIQLLYLPPYSHDFNPIEEGFSAMKSWIRRNRDYILGEMARGPVCDPHAMLWDLVFVSMTPEKIVGWYRDSGYH